MAWINSPNCLETGTAGGLLFFQLLRRPLSQIIVSCPSGLRKLADSQITRGDRYANPFKRIAVSTGIPAETFQMAIHYPLANSGKEICSHIQ